MDRAEATAVAIKAAGGPTELARALSARAKSEVTRMQVTQWRNRGRVPAEWVLDVEQAIECRVTRYQMRPDVFGEAR